MSIYQGPHLPAHRLVALHDRTNRVLGWITVGPISSRCVRAEVIECSV